MELWKRPELLEMLGNAGKCLRPTCEPRPEAGGGSDPPFTGNTGNIPKSGKTPEEQSPGNINGLCPELPFRAKKMGKSFEGPQDPAAPPGPGSAPLLPHARGSVLGVLGVRPHNFGGPGGPLWSRRWGHLVTDWSESTRPRRKSSGWAAKPRRPWGGGRQTINAEGI